MENIFNILTEYNKLDTSMKRENFINEGFMKKKWEEVSFNAVIEDLNDTRIYAYPLSGDEEKLEHMIFIRYHKNVPFRRFPFIKIFVNKFPIVKKSTVQQIREFNKFDIIKGVASFEEIYPIIYLKLNRLEN